MTALKFGKHLQWADGHLAMLKVFHFGFHGLKASRSGSVSREICDKCGLWLSRGARSKVWKGVENSIFTTLQKQVCFSVSKELALKSLGMYLKFVIQVKSAMTSSLGGKFVKNQCLKACYFLKNFLRIFIFTYVISVAKIFMW